MAGYFFNDFATAHDIITNINAPNLALQFDTYHTQRITINILKICQKNLYLTCRLQISSHPGRHEPIPSEIGYPKLFKALDQDEYQGYVSAKYNPKSDTTSGLGWLQN